MDIEQILLIAGGAVSAVLLLFAGFRAGVKRIADAIPGEDPFEVLDAKLTEKVDPIISAIARGVDKLNPNTHGGAGSGPEVKE